MKIKKNPRLQITTVLAVVEYMRLFKKTAAVKKLEGEKKERVKF